MKKQESAESSNGDFDSTVFYADYGTEVSVEAPPSSDTVDFESVS